MVVSNYNDMNDTINLMKCELCGEERVSPSGEKNNPWICRSCGKTFSNGIEPKAAPVELEVISTEVMIIDPSVSRGRKGTLTKGKLNLPDVPFSQKELAAFNNIADYKHVYGRLHEMVDNGTLVKAGIRDNPGRGKDIQLYATPEVWARVKGKEGLPVVAVEA